MEDKQKQFLENEYRLLWNDFGVADFAWKAAPFGFAADSVSESVFSQGPTGAKLAVVGEATDEDTAYAQPFCGAAGDLLTRMLQAMGFNRSDVFLLSVGASSWPSVSALLASARPQAVLALGEGAARALLQTSQPLQAMRGRLLTLTEPNVTLLVTSGLQVLLDDPSHKKVVWEELKLLMARL